MSNGIEKLGIVGNSIVNLFDLDIDPQTPVYIGLNNRIHMENTHGETYREFESCISEILSNPEYVGVNPHDKSLEYYKSYNDVMVHIKLAVRSTNNGIYFARTLYEINSHSLKSYLDKGRVKIVVDNS